MNEQMDEPKNKLINEQRAEPKNKIAKDK